MGAFDQGLDAIEAGWKALPDDVRAEAGELLQQGCVLIGAALRRIGKDHLNRIHGPFMQTILAAVPDFVLKRGDRLMTKVEGKFPAAASFLKQVWGE